jgi:hypothetical protein
VSAALPGFAVAPAVQYYWCSHLTLACLQWQRLCSGCCIPQSHVAAACAWKFLNGAAVVPSYRTCGILFELSIGVCKPCLIPASKVGHAGVSGDRQQALTTLLLTRAVGSSRVHPGWCASQFCVRTMLLYARSSAAHDRCTALKSANRHCIVVSFCSTT